MSGTFLKPFEEVKKVKDTLSLKRTLERSVDTPETF